MAVVVALLLTILLGVMAFTIDAGYLYLKKNQYQNAVEAAAMAGVVALCENGQGYVEAVVRKIAEENGIPGDKGELTVNFGYYDETDAYSDFSKYKDFANEENMPADEYVNAVHVVYWSEALSLTGMGQDASISSTAVAYLKRIDMVSLDEDGEIQLGHNSIWNDVIFFSNGNIKYPQSASSGGGIYHAPEFNGCRLLAAGQIMSCPVDVVPYSWFWERMEVQWESGTAESGNDMWSGMDPITEVQPVNDDCMDEWRQKADLVYTPDQAGQDNILYFSDNNRYYIDPAGQHGVIFFDAESSANAVLQVGPWNNSGNTSSHSPNVHHRRPDPGGHLFNQNHQLPNYQYRIGKSLASCGR
ncbi:pilus assembly protein TadG-related protein [Desulfosarcina cetonica]|uniref:pilus assembly protein TadG-related protein n=1 Tax=Desulfosarcina cetonica TaxID=90730 RepID=UPI0006D0AFDD|nr:pilus assembly protein TadG-related protein [Desulfosarcina cetonica]